MNSKKLLEELRKLTPNFSLNEEEQQEQEDSLDEKEYSVKDVLDDEDKDVEDESEVEELEDLEDEEEQEHDEEDDNDEIMDLDGDGEADDVHAITLLKSAYNASSEDTQHAIVSIIKLIYDNDIDMDSIEKFLDEVDFDVEDEDDFSDLDDDLLDMPSDDEDELEDEEEDEEDELEDEIEEALSQSESYFTNDAIVAEAYGVNLDGDMGEFISD